MKRPKVLLTRAYASADGPIHVFITIHQDQNTYSQTLDRKHATCFESAPAAFAAQCRYGVPNDFVNTPFRDDQLG